MTLLLASKAETDFAMKRLLFRLWSMLDFHSVRFLSLSKSFLHQILDDRKSQLFSTYLESVAKMINVSCGIPIRNYKCLI